MPPQTPQDSKGRQDRGLPRQRSSRSQERRKLQGRRKLRRARCVQRRRATRSVSVRALDTSTSRPPTRCFAVTSRRRRLRHHRVGLALLPAAKELLSLPAAARRLALLVACLVSRDPRFTSLPAREHITTTRRPFDGQHLPLPSLCCRGHTQYPAATRAKTSCVHSYGDGSVSSCASVMCDHRARPICTPTYQYL